MPKFDISTASVNDMRRLGRWSAELGWNPGKSDWQTFYPADPSGFLFGRLDGEPVASISAVRYGDDYAFVGHYIAQPSVRGQGYGIRTWNAGLDLLAGRNIGLDGVVEQQDNYRKSGFRRVWNNVRYEGVPAGADGAPSDVVLIDARTISFTELAKYDRRFSPAARDAFLSAWISPSDRTALVAVRDGRLVGFGVLRAAEGGSRVGPLYASGDDIALALMTALAARSPGPPIAIDVPDINNPSTVLVEQLGLAPSFEAARMYTISSPDVEIPGIYGVTSLELG